MNTKVIIWIILLVGIVGIGAFFLIGQKPAQAPAPESTDSGDEMVNTNMPVPAPGSDLSAPEMVVVNDATTDTAESGTNSNDSNNTASELVVTYTANGFLPKTLTVHTGDTVTFVNESGRALWVGSDVHPTHTLYDGTTLKEHCASGANASFDQCGTGDTYSFTFTQAGAWKYHNHVQAGDVGTIVVTE